MKTFILDEKTVNVLIHAINSGILRMDDLIYQATNADNDGMANLFRDMKRKYIKLEDILKGRG